jgi:hypothetical protein
MPGSGVAYRIVVEKTRACHLLNRFTIKSIYDAVGCCIGVIPERSNNQAYPEVAIPRLREWSGMTPGLARADA